jgi:hypothetical protein
MAEYTVTLMRKSDETTHDYTVSADDVHAAITAATTEGEAEGFTFATLVEERKDAPQQTGTGASPAWNPPPPAGLPPAQ